MTDADLRQLRPAARAQVRECQRAAIGRGLELRWSHLVATRAAVALNPRGAAALLAAGVDPLRCELLTFALRLAAVCEGYALAVARELEALGELEHEVAVR